MKSTAKYSILNKRYNRLRITLRRHQWLIIGAFWLATFALGCIGVAKQLEVSEKRPVTDVFYRTIQLYVIEDGIMASGATIPIELELARFLAPIVAAYTALAGLATVFREKLKMFYLRFTSNHVVICGLGKKGLLLAKGFLERNYCVVVIEKDPNNSLLNECKDYGAILLIGNAANRGVLRSARVQKALYLISVCGDDGVNSEVAVHAYALAGDHKGRVLTCFAHIVDYRLCSLLREREIETQKVDSFRMEFFNIFDSGAKALLNKYPAFSMRHDAQCPRPHLLVVGMGHLGESLVVHAARNWWRDYAKDCGRLRITIIDQDAHSKAKSLRIQYQQMEKACELVPRQMDIQSPEFQLGNFLCDAKDNCKITQAYICLDNDSLGLIAGLSLLRQMKKCRIPIVVRMTHNAGLATLLQGVESRSGFSGLDAFGILDQTCTPELLLGGTHEIIARAIHDDYVSKLEKDGKTPQINPSMVPWEELPEGLKESNRRQADHTGAKLKKVGCEVAPQDDWDAELFNFTPEEIELLAEKEHERWVEEYELAGWTFAAGEKNPQKKTHPYLIPWDQLTEEVKELDRDTVRGMPSFLAKAGFQVFRTFQKSRGADPRCSTALSEIAGDAESFNNGKR